MPISPMIKIKAAAGACTTETVMGLHLANSCNRNSALLRQHQEGLLFTWEYGETKFIIVTTSERKL